MIRQAGTIYVVDGDAEVRGTIHGLAREMGQRFAAFSTGNSALHEISESCRGCLVVDVWLADMNGLDLYEALSRKGVVLPTILTSACADVGLAVRAMKLGAYDFVEKPFRAAEMLPKIRDGLRLDAGTSARSRMLKDMEDRIRRLTARERQILSLLIADKNNKEIGKELAISPRTVESHRANIKEKLELQSIGTLLIRCALATVNAHPVLDAVHGARADCERLNA